jgi:tRNA(fMet)-specific endonuclease VapC
LSRRVLLDSDVFSYILKRDTRRSLFEPHLRNAQPGVSVQTVAEVRAWAIKRKWGAKQVQLLDDSLAQHFVLALDPVTAAIWAEIMAKRETRGRPLAATDGWVPASAVQYKLPLLTHNQADFEGIPGLVLLRPTGP